MGTKNLDITSIIPNATGRGVTTFDPKLDKVTDNPLDRVETGALRGSPYYAVDAELGVEYFMPVTITYPDAEDGVGLLNGDTSGLLKTLELPFPVVSISSRKNIVETPLTERGGTVKELINIEGYLIKVRGHVIAATNDLPEAALTKLRELYENNTAVQIKCALTDIFLVTKRRQGSDTVVIRSINLEGLKGVKNVKPYEVEFISDEIFNLIDIS